ncbi:MAG: hypothetical protein KJO36_09480 [Acidimicrobiia bacterium]|nr:hypothetical protein [Acidimicrobiia bacterium]
MAGIGGIVDLRGRRIDGSLVERMVRAATGPNDGTVVRDGNEKLQIYSVPIAVEKPSLTWSRDGTIVVVADARLDSALPGQTAGHALLSDYEQHDTLTRASLDGDFAVVLIDSKKNLALAARDPMSMRPLVFYYADGLLLFASEPTHVLATGLMPRRIHQRAVGGHLAGGVLDLSWTFFEGIHQVEPAHIVAIDRDGFHSNRFWNLEPQAGTPTDQMEAAENLAWLLQNSVKARLPVENAGIMLSGGLDSATLAAAAARTRDQFRLPNSIKAWSFAYTETPEADERAVSGPLASALGIPVVDVDAEQTPPLADFPSGPDENDPLYGHYQPLLARTISRAAGDNVESMMLGNRGDLVVGSDIHDPWSMFIEGGWSRLMLELSHMGRKSTGSALWLDVVRPALVDRLPMPIRRRAISSRSRPWQSWVDPDFAEATGMAVLMIDATPRPPKPGPTGRRFQAILSPFQMRVATWMQRMHTQQGIRFVDPWSDVAIIRFVLGLSPGIVQTPTSPKKLSRLALETMVPRELVEPLSKTIPLPFIDQHLRGTAAVYVRELMSGMHGEELGFVREREMRAHFEEFERGKALDGNFWAALTLEMWLRNFW